jgi:hypothetical protein
VSEVRRQYVDRLGIGPGDQVVMAACHRGLMEAALGWPDARYRVRSGRDGADLELLDVLEHEDIAARFEHVVLASGDGIFGHTVAKLTARGVRVTVMSHQARLSQQLAQVASDVVYLDSPQVTLELPQASSSALQVGVDVPRAAAMSLAVQLLVLVAWLLPAGERSRYAEEFWSELSEIAQAGDGRLDQLAYAVRQVVSTLYLAAELRVPRRRSASP